jgi:hypothetical protein
MHHRALKRRYRLASNWSKQSYRLLESRLPARQRILQQVLLREEELLGQLVGQIVQNVGGQSRSCPCLRSSCL